MEAREIIEKFKSESGFVECIDMLTDYLKINNISIEEIKKILTEVFEYNKKLNNQLEKENLEFEKAFKNRESICGEDNVICDGSFISTSQVPTSSNVLDVSYYKIQVNSCTDLNNLISMLPKRNVENFDEIINMILVSLLEEEMDYRKMVYDSGEKLETEKEFAEIVETIRSKFEIIKAYRDHLEQQEDVAEMIQNQIIFLNTNYGNVCSLSDLKEIDEDSCEDFLKLLNSIIDGTFKNVKSFTLYKTSTLVSEVKLGQKRICFDKLEPNLYIINSMFIKKTDNGLSYRNLLFNRENLYRGLEGEIKEKLQSSEREAYLQENALLLEDIITMLKSGNKVKKLGENNGRIN